MQNKNNNKSTKNRSKLVLKSAVLTLVALLLIVIGYFGAGYLSGVL